MNQTTKTILKSMFVLAMVAISANALAVWQAPTAAPSGNNAQPPINVGSATQQKTGGLVVGGFKSFGPALFGDTTAGGSYIQFQGPTSSAICGVSTKGAQRYNSTSNVMEYCNGGNAWKRINDGWALAGNNINMYSTNYGGVGIGTGNNIRGSAGFQINAINTNITANTQVKGFLPPVMTTTQRNTIVDNFVNAPPATGLLVFNSTTNQLEYYNGTAWAAVGGGTTGPWTVSGNNIYNSNPGLVGIGTPTPNANLDVVGTLRNSANAYLSTTSGNVGIGTVTPGSKLQVNGSTALGYPLGTAGPTNGLAVNGNVGIGTATPGGSLELKAVNPDIILNTTQNNSFGSARIVAGSTNANSWTSSYMTFQTHGTNTSAFTNDLTLKSGIVIVGATGPTGTAKFQVVGDSYLSGRLGVGVNPTLGVSLDVVGSAQFTGTVGIGTGPSVNPASAKLILQGAGTGYGFVQTNGTQIVGSYVSNVAPVGGWYGTYSNHPLHFFTNNSNPLMTVAVGGNVGIGTTSPAGKLDIRSSASANYIFTDSSTSAYTSTFTMDNVGLKIGHNSGFRDIEFPIAGSTKLKIEPSGQVTIPNLANAGPVCADSTGKLIACPAGTLFGGVYVFSAPSTCSMANPATGACSCPAGFTARSVGIRVNSIGVDGQPAAGANITGSDGIANICVK